MKTWKNKFCKESTLTIYATKTHQQTRCVDYSDYSYSGGVKWEDWSFLCAIMCMEKNQWSGMIQLPPTPSHFLPLRDKISHPTPPLSCFSVASGFSFLLLYDLHHHQPLTFQFWSTVSAHLSASCCMCFNFNDYVSGLPPTSILWMMVISIFWVKMSLSMWVHIWAVPAVCQVVTFVGRSHPLQAWLNADRCTIWHLTDQLHTYAPAFRVYGGL